MTALITTMPAMPFQIILINGKSLIMMMAEWAGKIVFPFGVLFIRTQYFLEKSKYSHTYNVTSYVEKIKREGDVL